MSDNLERRVWLAGEEAAWLADKIVGANQYGNDAARLLRLLSETQQQLATVTAEKVKCEVHGYGCGLHESTCVASKGE